jgi:hypothetical protein
MPAMRRIEGSVSVFDLIWSAIALVAALSVLWMSGRS